MSVSQQGKQHLQRWKRRQQYEYKSDFHPSHFPLFWNELKELLPPPQVIGKKLNIVFMATGESPYPEIATLQKLLTDGYQIGLVVVIDRLYSNTTVVIKNKVKDLFQQSFLPHTIEKLMLYDNFYLPTIFFKTRKIKVDLLIGFNMNLVYLLQKKREEKEKLQAFYKCLYQHNPQIISINATSYEKRLEDGSLVDAFHFNSKLINQQSVQQQKVQTQMRRIQV
jgi:hypothetical protein